MELTKEQIEKETSLHARFTENDVNNYWSVRAETYVKLYDGDFSFMLDMKNKSSFTPGQIKAILNCARKAGSDASNKAQLETFEPAPVEELPVVNFDFSTTSEATVSEAKETDPEYAELAEINKRILEIQTKIKATQSLYDPLINLIQESEKEEELLFEDFQKRIQEMRLARQDSMAEAAKLQTELSALQTEIENQQRLHGLTLKNIAARQLFEETKKQYEELRKGKPWDDKILDYQWDDVCFMASRFLAGKKGVLNANDMGLGKTAESAFFFDIIIPLFYEKYDRLPHILWLTKKTLRFSTFKEIRRWNEEREAIVMDGNKVARDFQLQLAYATNTMVIANYDMMNTSKILDYEWDIVVMDEVHKLKGGANSNPTKIFENAVELSKKAKFILPLSGSPIQNHPKEMWAYLHIFDPVRFPDVRRFEREYCFGWGEKDDSGNPLVQVDWERIITAMKDQVIRHSKQECLPELPDKTREFRYVERGPEQDAIYQALRDDFFVYLDDNKDAKINITSLLAQLTRLRQVNIIPASIKVKQMDGTLRQLDCFESAKIDEAMDIVEQLVDTGEQVVVFSSQFNEPLHEMKRRVAKNGWSAEILAGENSSKFEQIESAFQNKEIQVLLVNMKTGGEGLNLQKSDNWTGGANHAIFLDLWWNPKFNEQAEDRLHRKGQKDAVTIHIIQCENSVDQFIAAKLEEKEAMIEGIMEDSELRNGSEWADVLRDLL
jgi:SNF2 family DNA or RNA helicase